MLKVNKFIKPVYLVLELLFFFQLHCICLKKKNIKKGLWVVLGAGTDKLHFNLFQWGKLNHKMSKSQNELSYGIKFVHGSTILYFSYRK